jgi:hypothetical protein
MVKYIVTIEYHSGKNIEKPTQLEIIANDLFDAADQVIAFLNKDNDFCYDAIFNQGELQGVIEEMSFEAKEMGEPDPTYNGLRQLYYSVNWGNEFILWDLLNNSQKVMPANRIKFCDGCATIESIGQELKEIK